MVNMGRKHISKYSENHMRRGISTEGDEMGTCTSASRIVWSVHMFTHVYIYVIVNKHTGRSHFLTVGESVPA